MTLSKNPPLETRLSKFVAIILMGTALTAGSHLRAQVVPPGTNSDACLVFSVRSTYSTTGYMNYSGSGLGLVILGPQSQGDFTNSWDNQVAADAAKRTIQGYEFYTDPLSKQKYFSKQDWNSGDRLVGLVDISKSNSTKPDYLISVANYAATSIDDYIPTGKAKLTKPNSTSPAIWIADRLTSSYKNYDLNADRGDGMQTDKFVGQSNQPRRSSLNKGTYTYTFNKVLTELVKTNDFESAILTVENYLKSTAGGGYQSANETPVQ